MSRLVAKGIVRSHSMRERRATIRSPVGIVSNCGVCGGLVYNAQRFMHMNDAYFITSAIWVLYQMKKLFDRILYELQYLERSSTSFYTGFGSVG